MADPTSRPHPLGVHVVGGGVHVAVLAGAAEQVEFCLIDADRQSPGGWRERRVPLRHWTHGVWHDHVPGVKAGQRYGFRVHGRWDPPRGLLHNPDKLMLDPYARAIAWPGEATVVPQLFPHTVDATFAGDHARRDRRDSLAHAPHGVVTAPQLKAKAVASPDVPWARTVVYEAHVKGLTAAHPKVPARLRGTYAGAAHPAVLEHLLHLGVTTVEFLPVHAILTEDALVRRGTRNYWGYSTLSYFAPEPSYAAAKDPVGVAEEFRSMVQAYHRAGLEVVLDVVYNHTCEGGQHGPAVSWRGLDETAYYRREGTHYVDTTGCGNSLDARNPRVVQMVLDSLRHWITFHGVDGFRFDLAPTVARGRDGFDPDHPFLVAARADPVIGASKLIAEPWDIGPHGWRTGQFPPPFAEWNDRFRDSVRDFWLGDTARARAGEAPSGVRDLATCLAGSADMFTPVRGPLASVNFITAHDGFTLADCTSYDVKHNEANGENNADGSNWNRTWNHGVEGPTDDPKILAARRQTHRNLLATVLLATGTPMLVAGDEFGRTQGGNNNAYCIDSPTTWIDWDLAGWQQDLLTTAAHLVALRRDLPALRQNRFFAGRPHRGDATKDLAWFAADGTEMDHERWYDPWCRTLQMYLHGTDEGPHDHSVLVVVQAAVKPVDVVLPGLPWGDVYRLLWDSARSRPPAPGDQVRVPSGTPVRMAASSVRVYATDPQDDV